MECSVLAEPRKLIFALQRFTGQAKGTVEKPYWQG